MIEFILVGIGIAGILMMIVSLVIPKRLGDNGEKMVSWRECLTRIEEKKMSLPTFSVAHFRAVVANGKKLSVLADYVIDLSRLKAHPGGDFLHHFEGRDMTPWFVTTHIKQPRAQRLFSAMVIGKLVEGDRKHPLLPEPDREHQLMFESYVDNGIFANKYEWFLWDLGEVVVGVGFGFCLMHLTSYFYTGCAITAFAAVRQGFLSHDVYHDSVFKDSNMMQKIVYFWTLSIWGVDLSCPLRTHVYHHAFVNVIGMDTALEMGPIKVHKKTDDPNETHLGIWQAIIFYGVAIWVVLPLYWITDLIDTYDLRNLYYIGKAIRLGMVLYFWRVHLPIVICGQSFFFMFGVFASLNHFHMPKMKMEDFLVGEDFSYVRSQAQSIQNTTSNRFSDWAIDHFTLHIEHHLFPFMPRRAYNTISPDVQELLARHNIPYTTNSVAEAFRRYNAILIKPF